ncbi:MAG: DUF4139 domain-containing protein [Candidatus Methanoplasma sp.]|nr:DUF4139 domain-containing protein [Candidatus Methanoplasma sp.]
MNNAKQTPTSIESRITDVTVYLSGAQITRKCAVPAAQGAQKYVFKKLPGRLQPESIQVSAGEGIVIHSVEHAVNYLQTADYSGKITQLQKKLDVLTNDRQNEWNKIELGQLEENMFAENRKLAGTESGLKADELKAAILFYNERMAAVRESRMACNLRIKELNEEINSIQAQLGRYTGTRSEPVSEITVTLAADGNSAGKELTLSYFIFDASWAPSYDIRAKDTNSNIALHYKAKVSQHSGENWEEVKMTLSTGNPRAGGVCPQLNPWYIDFYREVQHSQFQAFNAAPAMKMKSEHSLNPLEDIQIQVSEEYKPSVTVTESVTSVEYNITAPYTVASGDGGQDVEITVHSLPAKYRYYSIRKLEREVFLLAAVSGWEQLNLIAGEASIFFENRYVGKAYIDPRRADENIDLSLGVDKSVIVTRIRGKDFTAKTLTGGNVKQTRQWELTARNLKAVPIEIEMLDQVPVSVNKQITVDITEASGADLDKDTGTLTWKFTLKPSESKSASVKYVVTSPKNTTVLLE